MYACFCSAGSRGGCVLVKKGAHPCKLPCKYSKRREPKQGKMFFSLALAEPPPYSRQQMGKRREPKQGKMFFSLALAWPPPYSRQQMGKRREPKQGKMFFRLLWPGRPHVRGRNLWEMSCAGSSGGLPRGGAAGNGCSPRAGGACCCDAGCPLRERRDSSRLSRPGWRTRGGNVAAGLCPERVRRDESRLYVADFPCGRG